MLNGQHFKTALSATLHFSSNSISIQAIMVAYQVCAASTLSDMGSIKWQTAMSKNHQLVINSNQQQ